MTFGESRSVRFVFLCVAICGIAMIVFANSMVLWIAGVVLLVFGVFCMCFHVAIAILDLVLEAVVTTFEWLFRRK